MSEHFLVVWKEALRGVHLVQSLDFELTESGGDLAVGVELGESLFENQVFINQFYRRPQYVDRGMEFLVVLVLHWTV